MLRPPTSKPADERLPCRQWRAPYERGEILSGHAIAAAAHSTAPNQQPVAQGWTGPGGSCPHGYAWSGLFCLPREGAQDAIPLLSTSTCPRGWAKIGYCVRNGSRR